MLCCTMHTPPHPQQRLNIYYFCPISSGAIDLANQSYLQCKRLRECKKMNQNIVGCPLIIISIHMGG